MGYRIVIVVAAVVAQAPATAPKTQEPAPVADQPFKEARRLLQNGRYAEAEEALEAILAIAKKEPRGSPLRRNSAIILSLAECQASQGEYVKAIERLKAAEAEQPKNADLPARLSELYLTRGDWEAAEAAMRRAEKIDPDHLLARWVEARLYDLRGELDKAVVACKWFVNRYNERRAEIIKDADSLLLVGQASERYYRATRAGRSSATPSTT